MSHICSLEVLREVAKDLLGSDQNWLSYSKPCPQKEGVVGSILTQGLGFWPL
jgi:hypothetical protein